MEQVEWRYRDKRRETGWLLYPTGYQVGRKYPLVISSYRCFGFLRGGFGHGAPVPEHYLTQQGFAVLCADRDSAENTGFDASGKPMPAAPYIEQMWSWEAAIDSLAARGIIDPSQVALTGTSFSAIAANYAAVNSSRFKVIMTNAVGDLDPQGLYFLCAPGNARCGYQHDTLFTPGFGDPESAWQDISPALNVRRGHAPYLMQVTEAEYRTSLQFYTAYAHAGLPIEMVVYAGANHNIMEPSQRASAFQRSADWFRFWLGGEERKQVVPWGDETPQRLEAQYVRWRALRSPQAASLAGTAASVSEGPRAQANSGSRAQQSVPSH
jgi:dipeptidyl aminopeptidase/acylaminoacyl peptidase